MGAPLRLAVLRRLAAGPSTEQDVGTGRFLMPPNDAVKTHRSGAYEHGEEAAAAPFEAGLDSPIEAGEGGVR